MKQLEKKDLIIGQIYKHENGNIVKYEFDGDSNNQIKGSYIGNKADKFYRKADSNFTISFLKLATPEEKHWLEVCIAANSFISYEEAMKTFIPEYVECIVGYTGMTTESAKIGKIYKTSEKPEFSIYKWDYLFQNHSHRFKPSTKEAYDAQFIVKEQLEEPKDKVLQAGDYAILQVESSEGAVFELGDKIQVFGGSKNPAFRNKKYFTIQGFRWSNDKSKICAIFNDKFPNGIGLDKIELYSKPVVKELSLLEQAKLKYPIGTKVTNKIAAMISDLYPGDFTIDTQNFEENKNFITINLISGEERTIYNKKNNTWAEIVEDFLLPKTWWITVENERQLEIAKQYFSQYFNNLNVFRVGKTVGYVKNVLDNYPANAFNLLTTTKMNNPQITFEQFEQYVLHNGFKVGDKFNKQKSISNVCEYIVYEKEIIDLQYINNESVAFYKMVGNSYSGPQCRILTKNIVR